VDTGDNESGYSAADNVNSFDTPKIYPGDGRDSDKTPTVFRLYQNHPNPFNPETQIRFDLPESAHVRLVIYNLLGEQIRVLTDSRYQAGFHTLTWDGRNASGIAVPSGVYVYRLVTDQRKNQGVVGKMTLLR